MTVELRTASAADRPAIRELFDSYLRELAQFREVAVGATRASEYPYFDRYWSDPDRVPFAIWSNGKLAGFALVRRLGGADGEVMQLAEFFVRPEERRIGIGRQGVTALWTQLPGRWELQVMEGNLPAVSFWRRCVGAQARNWRVEEIQAADGRRLYFHLEV
jgi:predicted acetyltransferase